MGKGIITAVAIVLILCANVSATTIYSNDFEGGDTAGWNTALTGTDENGQGFLGLFGAYYPNSKPNPWNGDLVELTLGDIAAGHYAVSFDLYTMNTWDGLSASNGPDTIAFSINGVQVFNTWFQSNGTNGAGLASSGINDLLFSYPYPEENNVYVGNIRYSPSYEFYHTGGDLTLSFLGIPSQPEQQFHSTGFYDEPWALDNVAVASAAPVPEPTTLILLSTGLVTLAGFGRKKYKR